MAATNYTTPPELIIAASCNSWSSFLVFFLIAISLFFTGLEVESRYGYQGLAFRSSLSTSSQFCLNCCQTLALRLKTYRYDTTGLVNAIIHFLGQDKSLRSVPRGAGKHKFDDLVIPASLMISFGCLRPFYRAYIHMRLVLWWYGEEEIVGWLVQMAEDSRKRKEDKLQEVGRTPLDKVE